MHPLVVGQNSATSFPPPLRGRDREGGASGIGSVPNPKLDDKRGLQRSRNSSQRTGPASSLVRCRYPPPCPSPARGEGTVWHELSQITARGFCCVPAENVAALTKWTSHETQRQ